MNKIISFTFTLFAMAHISFGQVERWAIEDTISQDYLKELVFATDTPMYLKEFPMDIDEYLSHYHPVHINLDDDIDLIFNGRSGGESFSVEIYLNNGGKLELIESEIGVISNVTRKFPDAPLSIDFLQYGCCDDPINFYQQWTILANHPGHVIKSSSYYFLEGTEFPEVWDRMTKFRVINSPYTLRATPEIINEKPFTYHFENGNIIAEYSEGDTG